MWRYPPEFLSALSDLGLAPTAATPPSLVRDALNDLYRHELRRERERLRAGAVEKSGYRDIVIGLRKKYWPLTFQLHQWERICRAETPEAGRE
jgi:hypothetical protein